MNIFRKYNDLRSADKMKILNALATCGCDQYVALRFENEDLSNLGLFDEEPSLIHWDIVLSAKDLVHSLGLLNCLEEEYASLHN